MIISTVIIHFLALGLPLFILQIYDRLIPSQNAHTLGVMALGLVAFVVLETILRMLRGYVLAWYQSMDDHHHNLRTMDDLLEASLTRLKRQDFVDHMARFHSQKFTKDAKKLQKIVTWVDALFFVVFAGIFYWVGAGLLAVPLVVAGVYLPIKFWVIHHGGDEQKAIDDVEHERTRFLTMVLAAFHSLKSMRLERVMTRRFEALQYKISTSYLSLGRHHAISEALDSALVPVLLVGVMVVGVPMVLNDGITSGVLIACVILSARMGTPIKQMGTLLLASKTATRQDHAMMDEDAALDTEKPDKKEATELPTLPLSLEGRLEIKGLAYTNQNREGFLFEDINLDVYHGECIRLVGDMGAGKSTLLRIIAGLYAPTNGEVKVDGFDVHTVPSGHMAPFIAYSCADDNKMFQGTIRQNLTGFGTYDQDSVLKMVAHLDIGKVIETLPQGDNTMLLGEGDTMLSRGTRQRITLARKLAAHPKLIILDDIDKSLGQVGYMAVYKFLAKLKGKATIILVTEDMNMALLADKTYHLSQFGQLRLVTNDQKDLISNHIYQELRL